MYPNPLYPNPLYPAINSAQQQLYPTQYYYPTPNGAYPQPQLPPPPGLGFSPHPHYPMANAMYPYPLAPAPAPTPASSDKAGTRQRSKKQGKQGNKTPPKEKTGILNTTLPRTSLLHPSKLHFYCHYHGWVATHGWPSRYGGHHGDLCMFMKSRPSEFTPAMLAARTPDVVPNHPGSANVQRTNVCPLPQCSPCTLPPSLSRVSLTTSHHHPITSISNQCSPHSPTHPVCYSPCLLPWDRRQPLPPSPPVLLDAFSLLYTTSPLPHTTFPLSPTSSHFASPNPFAALESPYDSDGEDPSPPALLCAITPSPTSC